MGNFHLKNIFNSLSFTYIYINLSCVCLYDNVQYLILDYKIKKTGFKKKIIG